MTAIGYLRKRTSAENGDSPWGIHYESIDGCPDDVLLDLMGNSGVKWSRFAIWPFLDGQEHDDWEHVDKIVDGLVSRGVRPVLNLGCSSAPGQGWSTGNPQTAVTSDGRKGMITASHSIIGNAYAQTRTTCTVRTLYRRID